MGNAPSANKAKKRQPAWAWEFKDGRAYIKPRRTQNGKPRRPLFKKPVNDNNDNWFLFGPTEEEKRRNAERNRALMARRPRS